MARAVTSNTDKGIVDGQLRFLSHEPMLDGLRGIAVAMVVCYHLLVFVEAVGQNFGGGFLGVDVFFVLSGFLITALLLRERAETGSTRFAAFYVRRALRLLPALALFLAGFSVYAAAVELGGEAVRRDVLGVAFYYFNWVVARSKLEVIDELRHLWSLSVEEQFYIVWPLVVAGAAALVGRRRPKLAIALIALAILAVAAQRFRLFEQGEFVLSLYVRTDARADGLLVGALVAVAWTYRVVSWERVPLVVGLGCALFVAICTVTTDVTSPFLYRGGFTLIAIAIGAVILTVFGNPPEWLRTALTFMPLRLLGKVSYATYIWHLPVFFAVNRFAPSWPPVARAALGLASTALIVGLSWVLVEQPALAYKDRRESRP